MQSCGCPFLLEFKCVPKVPANQAHQCGMLITLSIALWLTLLLHEGTLDGRRGGFNENGPRSPYV